MLRARSAITGIAGAGAAGALIVSGAVFQELNRDEASTFAGDETVCIRSDLRFFEDAPKGCVKKQVVARWRGAAVLDNSGAPVRLRLAHPTDFSRAPETVLTCSKYDRLTGEGWYAESSREMRREAYFMRACMAVRFLLTAAEPKKSYFAKGALSERDVEAMSNNPPLRIAPRNMDVAEIGAPNIEPLQDGLWRLQYSDQSAIVQEISHADFNGDGVGDVLAFIAVTVREGTATAGAVGLIEKAESRSAARFRAPRPSAE
ncbi:MAG: hypothetical protein AAF850_03830 [Pseudomonadota bacterium]